MYITQVVSTCRQHLPEWGQGATEDPRLQIFYQDALVYLETTEVRMRPCEG